VSLLNGVSSQSFRCVRGLVVFVAEMARALQIERQQILRLVKLSLTDKCTNDLRSGLPKTRVMETSDEH
jgi:hypothetical protein